MSQKKKNILYFNAYIWNLEKQYRGTYLQGRDRHTNREQTYGFQGRKRG